VGQRIQVADETGLYAHLARKARTAFAGKQFPLTETSLRILLLKGNDGLASCLGVSVRTLHRLLARDGLRALELRTWARREAVTELLSQRVSQAQITRLTGLGSIAYLQAFIRRELHTTCRAVRRRQQFQALAETA
jgi:AraC-like DNA-binding protein